MSRVSPDKSGQLPVLLRGRPCDCRLPISFLIDTYEKDHGLARQLDGAKARADAEQADESKRAGANLRSDATKVADRGASYLLRRLAREAPEVLARYAARPIAGGKALSQRWETESSPHF